MQNGLKISQHFSLCSLYMPSLPHNLPSLDFSHIWEQIFLATFFFSFRCWDGCVQKSGTAASHSLHTEPPTLPAVDDDIKRGINRDPQTLIYLHYRCTDPDQISTTDNSHIKLDSHRVWSRSVQRFGWEIGWCVICHVLCVFLVTHRKPVTSDTALTCTGAHRNTIEATRRLTKPK